MALFRIMYDQVLLSFFQMESLGSYDRLVLEDDDGNRCNILGATRFDQLDFEKLKEHLVSRLKTIHRGKSRLVKFFGVWYFKKMSDIEFETQTDVIIQ